MKKFTKELFLMLVAVSGALTANAQCTASFTWNQPTSNVIDFTNTSTGTTINTAYYYDFGDMSYGYGPNLSHTYMIPGTYNVCLTIMDSISVPTCTDTYCTSVTVTGSVICNLTAAAYATAYASCGTCADGIATAYPYQGTTPYTYLWSPGGQTTQNATGLLPGVYTVCVTDANGCTACAFDSVFVSTAGCVASFSTNINSNSVDFTSTSTGTNPNTGYYWNFGDANSGTGNPVNHIYYALGTYYVTLYISDSAGCSSSVTDSVTITTLTFSNCNASFYVYPDSINPGNYIAINNSTGLPPLGYAWNWGDGSPIDYTAYPTHTYTVSGTYNISLTITDAVGCTSVAYYSISVRMATTNETMSPPVTINVYPPGGPSAVAENTFSAGWQLFPNPATDETNIAYTLLKDEQLEIIVFDLPGNKIKEIDNKRQAKGAHQLKFSTSALPAGIYIVKMQAGNTAVSKLLTVTK